MQSAAIASRAVVIVIDLAEGRVSLDEPSDFTGFSVVVDGHGEDGDLAEVVGRSGLGRLGEDRQHVVVDPVALRALAGPAADERWDEGFSGMCAYAARKGWMEDDGVVAHIERRRDTGSVG